MTEASIQGPHRSFILASISACQLLKLSSESAPPLGAAGEPGVALVSRACCILASISFCQSENLSVDFAALPVSLLVLLLVDGILLLLLGLARDALELRPGVVLDREGVVAEGRLLVLEDEREEGRSFDADEGRGRPADELRFDADEGRFW